MDANMNADSSQLANLTDIIIMCPHCNMLIFLEKLNCCIFRHGVLKKNAKQINPHAPRELCDYYVREDLIYGCGKPFKIEFINNSLQAIICDYI